MTDCARGCTIARQHVTTCEDDDCRGCKPREAHHGLLCNGCHARLVDMLDNAPKQHRLLLAMTEPVVAPDYSAVTTARIGDGWRTDSDQPHQGPYARPAMAGSEGGAPVRMAALETGQELADMLSQWVEDLVERTDLHGPVRLLAPSGPRHGRWQWSDFAQEMVWREPPKMFEVESSCRWLVAQVARLEQLDFIGDLFEEMADVMSRSHSLAPWREEVAKLRGIDCPECHHRALVRYGGDDFVTCMRCNAHIDWGRYWVWVRMLVGQATGREA